MKFPTDCESISERILRLNKPWYGLKQTAWKLYKLLVSRLIDIGFEQCLLDACVMIFMIDGTLARAVMM